jgi:hypothetical protein
MGQTSRIRDKVVSSLTLLSKNPAEKLHCRLAETHLWVQPAIPPVTFRDTCEDTPLIVTLRIDKPRVVMLSFAFVC